MTEPQIDPNPARGNPPNRERLAELLGETMPWWNDLRSLAIEMGATWKWAYSENTGSWNYRSYLEGDRFFATLTPIEDQEKGEKKGFEASLNLKQEEWNAVSPTPEENPTFEALRAKALESGDDPAWLHVPVKDAAALSLLVKLFVARGQRVQKPRRKPGKKKK